MQAEYTQRVDKFYVGDDIGLRVRLKEPGGAVLLTGDVSEVEMNLRHARTGTAVAKPMSLADEPTALYEGVIPSAESAEMPPGEYRMLFFIVKNGRRKVVAGHKLLLQPPAT